MEDCVMWKVTTLAYIYPYCLLGVVPRVNQIQVSLGSSSQRTLVILLQSRVLK